MPEVWEAHQRREALDTGCLRILGMIFKDLDPEEVEPIGRRVLAVKYEKPEKVGSIWLNPVWRVDHSRALWECVKAGESAQAYFEGEDVFGERIEKDWILITPPNRGIHVPMIDTGEREGFLLRAEDVQKVIPWTPGEDRELRRGLQIGGDNVG